MWFPFKLLNPFTSLSKPRPPAAILRCCSLVTRTREQYISCAVDMNAATNILALLLLVLGSCQGLRRHHVDKIVEEETELVAQPSKFGSLWPRPQKVQISDVSFKLTGFSFRIVDAKQSSAGLSCTLLQDAYRRCQLCFGSLWLDSLLLCDKLPFLSLCRYYEYMFGGAKRSGKNKSRRTGSSDLTELQVWITSPDSDCDAYPNVKSDESCEYLLPENILIGTLWRWFSALLSYISAALWLFKWWRQSYNFKTQYCKITRLFSVT